MKYISLLALCSILLLVPACKDGSCGTKCCPATTTYYSSDTVGSEVAAEEFVEVDESQAAGSRRMDKEDLEEDELVEVMANS